MFRAFGVMNGGTMTTKEGKTIDKTRAEELLVTAAQLQAAFWDALSELEAALERIEISATRDLSETTIDDLLHEDDAGIEPN